MSKVFSTMVVIVLAVPVLGGWNVHEMEPSPRVDAIAAIIADWEVSCKYICSKAPCDDNEEGDHVVMPVPDGEEGDADSNHAEWDCIDGGCEVHACGGSLAGQIPVDLDERLMALRTPELRNLIAREERVQVNVRRNALQVMGCADRVVFNLPLEARKAMALAD